MLVPEELAHAGSGGTGPCWFRKAAVTSSSSLRRTGIEPVPTAPNGDEMLGLLGVVL